MPFKSEKQRKWMHANEPEMAKKWEKEEAINESNASVIRKKLLKKFGDDPLYREFILAKTPKEQRKALDTLKSIRGDVGVRLMQTYAKKLQGESVKEDRDYKDEYKKFQSSTKAKKYRAELNQYNRKKGTYGNGDKKDASHKGGKIVGFENQSVNRSRKEKSRMKKENIRKFVNEAVEPQGNMAKIAKIVKRKQASKLGGVMIDMQSASLLMKLWDAVSDKDKEKMNTLNPKVLTTVIKKLWSRVNLKLPM